jgi:hypothetical protein
MPRLMKATGRFVAFAALLAVSLAGCTGEEGDGGASGGTGGTAGVSGATGGDVGPTPVTSGAAGSGTYEYENGPLRVVLDIDGTAGTMRVENGTDRELPPPDFYILDASDGHEIEGEVESPAPVRPGATATFDISFSGIEVGEIGVIALLFGQDNYGLFVRTA